MKKQMKRIFAVVMALTMVFAMSASAFAASGNGYYLLSDEGTQAYTTSIHVKAVIDSKQEDDYSTGTATSEVYDVVLTPTGSASKVFNVRDVMLALSAQHPEITFYDADLDLIDDTSTYFNTMQVGEHVYMPSLPMMDMALDGWYFRVNDKLPIESMTGAPITNGMKGATIATTTVKAGDVVHFYWNYPYNKTQDTVYSAKYLTADGSYNNGRLTIQLKSSYDYFDNSYNWNITNFANFSGGTGNYAVKVYDATTSSATPVATGTIPASGQGTINCTLTTGHDYYIRVDSASYDVVYGSDSDVWIVDTTMAYSKLSA